MKKRPKTQSSVPPMHVILSHRRTHSHDENNSMGYLSDGPLNDNDGRPRSKSVMTLDRKPNEGPRYHGKFEKVKMSKSPKSSPVLRHRTKSTISAPDNSLLTDKRLSRSFESLAIFDDPSSGENNDMKEVEETIEPLQGKPPKGERRGTLQRLFTKAKSSFDLFAKAEKAEKVDSSKSDTTAHVTQISQKSDDVDDDEDDDNDNDDAPWKPRPRATSEPLRSGDMLFSLVAFDDVTKSLDDVTKSLDDLSFDRRNMEETLQDDSMARREMSNSGSVFLSPQNNEGSSTQSNESQPNVTTSQEYTKEQNQTAEAMVEVDMPDDEISESLQVDLETSSEDGTIPEAAEQADDNYELIFEMEMDKSLDEMQLDIQDTPTEDPTEDMDNTVTDEHGAEFPEAIDRGAKPATIEDSLEIHTVNTDAFAENQTTALLEGDRDSSDKLRFNELASEEVKKNENNTADVPETISAINESPVVDEIPKQRVVDASMNIVTIGESMQSQAQNSDEDITKDEAMRATKSQVSQLVTSTQSPGIRNQDEDINEAPSREKGTDAIDDAVVNIPQSGTQISSLMNVQLQDPENVGVTPCPNAEDSLRNTFKSAQDLEDNEGNGKEIPVERDQGRILTVESKDQYQSRQIQKEDNPACLLYEVQTKDPNSVEENHGLDATTGNQNSEHYDEVEKRSRKDVPQQMANLYEVSADIPNINFDTIPPESKQIILRTVDMNQVSISKTEPIQETVCKTNPIDHSVLAMELVDDTALGFPGCCSSIPRCTCDAVTYSTKRNALVTIVVSKQDAQIVLNETKDRDEHPEVEDETCAPGTDAVKHSTDLSNKIELNVEESQNTTESNENESNKEVNTEFTTKWKIYVYHTTVVLETISGPVAHTPAPDATNNSINQAEEKHNKSGGMSDEQCIGINNMAENNDDTPRDVFETINTNPDPPQSNQECPQYPNDIPIPFIRIESPTSAESSFSGAESGGRSNDDTSKVNSQSKNQEDLVTTEQDDESPDQSRDTETPENWFNGDQELNIVEKDSVAREEISTAEETSGTEETNNKFSTQEEPTIKDIDENRVPHVESSVHPPDDTQKQRPDGLCPTETTNMLSEILHELESTCHNDEDNEEMSRVQDKNYVNASESTSDRTNRFPSATISSYIENKDQGLEKRQLDEEKNIKDTTTTENIKNHQENDDTNRSRIDLPSTDALDESKAENEAELCRVLSQDENRNVIQNFETSSDDGSIPHPDKEEALETCRSVKIRNLISLFESGPTRKSKSSTLPRSGVNPPIRTTDVKARTVSTLPRKISTVHIRKNATSNVTMPLQSDNIWTSMPNLAQKNGTNFVLGTNDSQDRQDTKRTVGAREEIQTLQKKKFVSSVILKFQQLEKQSLEEKKSSSQPIKSRNGALKYAQQVGRAKSTSNLTSEEVSRPVLHQIKPHCVSTGNLLHEQPLPLSQDESIDLKVFEFDDAQDIMENSLRKCKSEVFFTDSHESDSSRASGMESARNPTGLNFRHGFRKLSLRSDSSDLSDGYLAEAEDSDVSPAHIPSSFTREV